MRRICIAATAGWLACLGFWAGEAQGQIRQRSDGRLTDANPLIGSGGYNLAAPRPLINSANLIVTGNVTGGQAFQGFSPIRNPSQFYTPLSGDAGTSFTGLPSAGLSNFYRDTTGIQDVLGGAGTLYQPRPYFAPEQTITNAGAIAGGLNVPGSSVPRDVYALPYQNPQLPQAQMLVPPEPPLGDTRLESGSYLQHYLQQPQPGLSGPAYDQRTVPQANLTNPWIAQSNLFSSNLYMRRQQQEYLARLPSALRAQESAEETPTEEASNDVTIDMRIDPRISPDPITYEDPGQTEADFEQESARDYALPPAATAQTPYPSGWAIPIDRERLGDQADAVEADSAPTGEYDPIEEAARRAEAYVEGYLQRRREELLTTAMPDLLAGRSAPGGGGSPELDDEATARDPKPKLLPGQYSLPKAEDGSRRARIVDQLAEIYSEKVVTLVSKSDTRLNRQLALAEDLTRAGQYFRASGQYEIAEALDPSNPLPYVGRAHALIGAGDYHSAARLLIRGIRAWPGFANFRLDLNSFITDPGLLDRRRADLEQRLAERERPEFRFLLGYIEFYMGLEEFGLENLERAATTAPKDSFIAAFPEMLRQRVRNRPAEPAAEPESAPTSRPAETAAADSPGPEPDPPPD